MFSADLSWNDDATEKVGQRRERRARARGTSISSSTSGSRTGLTATGIPKKESISQLTSFSSIKGSFRRPSTTTSRHHKKPSLPPVDPNFPLKDPLHQPDYIYCAKLEPKLPSGAPLDPPPPFGSINDIPLPVRNNKSRRSNESPPQTHQAWSVADRSEAENICQAYEQVKDDILTFHNPEALLPHKGTTFYDEASLEVQEPAELANTERGIRRSTSISITSVQSPVSRDDSTKTKYLLPTTTSFEPTLSLPSIFHTNTIPEDDDGPPPPVPPKPLRITRTPTNIFRAPTIASTIAPPRPSQWSAPKAWEIVQSEVEIRKILDSDSSPERSGDDKRESIFTGSHFQRFVRRMESAGPRIILERLKEEWDLPGDRAMTDELQLEKHLWALTALQMQSMDRFTRPSDSPAPTSPLPPISLNRKRKILELDGSLGEIYQLSAIYPNSRIYHLTSQSRGSSIPLPSQAVQHTIRIGSPTDSLVSIPVASAVGVLPLPYANASMHHIKSTRLPALLPASQLPALLTECYRVLKPGGVLELRLTDATPERGTMGPKLATWLEERLLLGLEQEFRCQRPVMMVPRWARDAGFVPLPFKKEADAQGMRSHRQSLGQLGMARCLRLPAAATESYNGHRDVVAQVGVLVSRALWKDAWGSFVSDEFAEHWWWENPDIIEECREWKTCWDVGTMFVVKEE